MLLRRFNIAFAQMTKVFNRKVGAEGEELAAKFLEEKGYKVLERNYRTKFGEIDLICLKNNTLVFVEVKLKHGEEFGSPEEMIGVDKLGRIQRMAEYYLIDNPKTSKKYESYSIDAICIVLTSSGDVERINHYENIGFE